VLKEGQPHLSFWSRRRISYFYWISHPTYNKFS